MLSGSGNSNTVQYFKEVEIKHTEQVVGRSIAGLPFTPCVERLLCVSENIINCVRSFQLAVEQR